MCWAWIYSPGNINGKSSLPLKIHLTMLFVLLHISLLRHPRPGWTVCSEQPINHQIKWKNTEDKTRRTLRSFVHLTTSKLAHQYLTHSQQIFFFLLLPSFWRCFMTFHVPLLLCFAILTVTKFPIKFGLNLSRYHETYWKKMSLAFSFDHKSREKVSCKKKNWCKKILWKPPAWISSKGEEQEWDELFRQRTPAEGAAASPSAGRSEFS